MKVLHAISSIDPRAGGPAAALVGLTTAQVRAGLDVTVLATHGGDDNTGPIVEKLTAQGAKVALVGPATGPLGRHPDLAGRARTTVAVADVVHVHALWEEVQHQAAAAARSLARPYIFRPCGMLDPWSLNQSKWKKRVYMAWRLRRDLNAAAAIHYTAPAESDLARPLGLRPPSIVEPNGVSLAEFADLPPRGAFRDKHPETKGRRIILFLSRVDPKKGLDLLVPAFAKADPVDTLLVVAGPDASGHTAEVQRLADVHRVRDRILFTGMLQGRDKVEAFTDADLFCLPSYQENFGIAVAEALAAGLPVVISDQVNIHADITAAGVGGVTPCRVEPLAAELKRWMTDENLRTTAASKARPFVWSRYDWNQIAARWAEHYGQLLARRS
jgi:glycosyltransferase involved in cell wall biosynthesis